MKRDLREMIGNEQILNSPPSPYSLVYTIFVDDTYVQHFYSCDQIDCLFLTIYQRFHLFVGFNFDKLAPPWTYVSKDVLNII